MLSPRIRHENEKNASAILVRISQCGWSGVRDPSRSLRTYTTPAPEPHPARTTAKVLAASLAWIASAGVVAAVTAVYTTDKTVDANRIQAERDYLRGERHLAYATFEACERKVSDAITKAVTVSGDGAHPAGRCPTQKRSARHF